METEALIKWARDPEARDREPMALIDNLVSALEHTDAEAKKAWAEVRRQDDRATEAEAELKAECREHANTLIRWNTTLNEVIALRVKIQPVLDAWNDPGINPQYHNNWKNLLRREWWTLFKALDNMAKNDLKELFATEYTDEKRIQAHLRGGDPT